MGFYESATFWDTGVKTSVTIPRLCKILKRTTPKMDSKWYEKMQEEWKEAYGKSWPWELPEDMKDN